MALIAARGFQGVGWRRECGNKGGGSGRRGWRWRSPSCVRTWAQTGQKLREGMARRDGYRAVEKGRQKALAPCCCAPQLGWGCSPSMAHFKV